MAGLNRFKGICEGKSQVSWFIDKISASKVMSIIHVKIKHFSLKQYSSNIRGMFIKSCSNPY
jgi:hypothetical protein